MQQNKPLKLIKYGHNMCNPCNMIKPILHQISELYKDSLDFEDVNTFEADMDEIIDKGIKSVPTIILYKNDVEVWRNVGLISKENIENKIKQVLESN